MIYLVCSLAPLLLLVKTPNNGLARVSLHNGEDQQGRNVNGRVLYNGHSENGEWIWQAGNAGAGVYYYQVAADDKRHTGKLVKY